MKTGTGRQGREILDAVDEDMLDQQEATSELVTLRKRIPTVPTLSKKERKAIWQRGDVSSEETQASINIIVANDAVAQALKISGDEVRAMVQEANFWDGFVTEARGLLEGVSDANLIRRERIAVLGARAYHIAQQLVRDPEHDGLREHIDGVRRLKRLGRRRKRTAAAEEAAAEPPASEEDE